MINKKIIYVLFYIITLILFVISGCTDIKTAEPILASTIYGVADFNEPESSKIYDPESEELKNFEPSQLSFETIFTVTEFQIFPPKQIFDDEFEIFYKNFVTAIYNKDIQFIDSILDEMVLFSYGWEMGKDRFHEFWESENKYNERDLWTVLEEIVALGGILYQSYEFNPWGYGKCFIAPYTSADFATIEHLANETDKYAEDFFVIINKDVNVYKEENTESEVIDILNYNIVEFYYTIEFYNKHPDDFVSVSTFSGEVGYIQKKNFRSLAEYRLCIEKKDNGWKLLWLVAGI